MKVIINEDLVIKPKNYEIKDSLDTFKKYSVWSEFCRGGILIQAQKITLKESSMSEILDIIHDDSSYGFSLNYYGCNSFSLEWK